MDAQATTALPQLVGILIINQKDSLWKIQHFGDRAEIALKPYQKRHPHATQCR